MDYTVLPGRVQTGPGTRTEVVEFFMYSCDHCFEFEPRLRHWAQQLPADVVLRRIPIAFGAVTERYARIYYTAQRLDVLSRIHSAAFASIQRYPGRLRSDTQIRAFFVAHGVQGADFDRVYKSVTVAKDLNRGALLAQLYNVVTVPSFGVDGRYLVNPTQARTYPRFLDIVDYLAANSR